MLKILPESQEVIFYNIFRVFVQKFPIKHLLEGWRQTKTYFASNFNVSHKRKEISLSNVCEDYIRFNVPKENENIPYWDIIQISYLK